MNSPRRTRRVPDMQLQSPPPGGQRPPPSPWKGTMRPTESPAKVRGIGLTCFYCASKFKIGVAN